MAGYTEGEEASSLAQVLCRLRPSFERRLRRQFPSIPHHDREDLFQETCTRALEACSQVKFENEENVRGWVWAIAHNLVVDFLRHQGTRAANEVPVPPDVVVERGPAEEAMDHEQQELLDRCLGKLAPEDRALLEMRYLQRMSSKEIAAALRVHKGTVGSRLSRIREELRELLGNSLEDFFWARRRTSSGFAERAGGEVMLHLGHH
jgi:RNA polymerase sigma-70 factor (ECF subfamily)